MKRLITVVVVLLSCCFGNLNAQQDPLYTQYMFNTLSINPGYAGSREVLSLMLLARQQWVGFDGAPKTGTFTAHSPVYSNMAVGGSIIYDSYGPVNQTSFFVDYAYHLKLNEKLKMSLGLKGGMNYYSIDYNSLQRTVYADDAYSNYAESSLMPNFGFGVYLYSSKFYFGLSVPKIIENTYEEAGSSYGEGKEFRHYYGMMGMAIRTNDWLVLKPSILTRLAEGSPLNVDLNINSIIKDKFWLGVMYRLNESFGGIVQYQISPQFRFGYAFDMNTNELSSYNSGSHEIMLNYEFNFDKKKVLNPRYF